MNETGEFENIIACNINNLWGLKSATNSFETQSAVAMILIFRERSSY
jgi:hypothetical protein